MFVKVYEVKNQIKQIRHGESNGNYIAFSLFDQTANEYFKPDLILYKLIKRKNRITVSNERHLTLPFSNTISDVKFIKKNFLLIAGFIEYCTIELSDKKFIVHHYTLHSKSAPFLITNGHSFMKGVNVFFTRYSIFYNNLEKSVDTLSPFIDLSDFNYRFDVNDGINKVVLQTQHSVGFV